MVVPGLRFAKSTAPRKLQSLAAAVQAEAAGLSSVLSTVMLASSGAAVSGAPIGAERKLSIAGRALIRCFVRCPNSPERLAALECDTAETTNKAATLTAKSARIEKTL